MMLARCSLQAASSVFARLRASMIEGFGILWRLRLVLLRLGVPSSCTQGAKKGPLNGDAQGEVACPKRVFEAMATSPQVLSPST